MTSSLWAAASALAALVLSSVLGWLQRQQAASTGKQIEAGAVTAAAATTEAAIAQAVVGAPVAQAGVVAELNAGKF